MTQPGIESRSPRPLANTLTIISISLSLSLYIYIYICIDIGEHSNHYANLSLSLYIYIYIYIFENHSINNRNLFQKSKIIIAFRIFSHECKLSIVWNCFKAKIIFISQKYLFRGCSKWRQIK